MSDLKYLLLIFSRGRSVKDFRSTNAWNDRLNSLQIRTTQSTVIVNIIPTLTISNRVQSHNATQINIIQQYNNTGMRRSLDAQDQSSYLDSTETAATGTDYMLHNLCKL